MIRHLSTAKAFRAFEGLTFHLQVTLKDSKCFDKPITFMAVAYNDGNQALCATSKYAATMSFTASVPRSAPAHSHHCP